jgi:nucleoside-diphosphate-sugar epimerase
VILVTGATGFLGGAVARALHARGDGVRVLVRNPASVRDFPSGVALAKGDVTEPRTLEGAFGGVDLVVHAAGMLGRAGAKEAEYMRLHAEGTRNVLAASLEAGVPRVLHVSSPGVLGPITTAEPADEEAPLAPSNVYERSKAAAEREVRAFEAAHGARVTVVRPEFVYGPGDMHVLGLFRAIKRRIFFYIGTGDALCHPTFIDDVVSGMLAAIDRGATGRIYHLAGPSPVSIRTLAETFARAMRVPPPRPRVPELVMRTAVRGLRPLATLAGRALPIDESGIDFFTQDRKFSTARARRELGWEPLVDVEAGAARTVRWYEERGLL